jgi:predicted CXXCH cytochrome family protein
LKPGKNFFDFKPGMKLTEVLDVFMPLFEGGKEDFIMASHTERMKESKCYLGSDDQFNCLSCHDPHVSTKYTEMASYNKVCLDCHVPNENSCTLPEEKRFVEKNGCVGCHMPEGGSRDIPHERTHDHKIAIPKTAEQLKEERVFKGLIAVNNHNTDSLTKARGYLQEFETYHADEHYLDSAYSYLNYRENKNNPLYFNAIVNYYFLKKNHPALISFVEGKGIQDVLNDYLNEQDYSNYDAWTSYRIGQAYESDANLMIAYYFYKNAIALAKYNLEFQNKYGSLLTKMKKIPEAKKVFQFVVSEYPKFASAHVNLGYVFALSGDFKNAELHYKKALALNPDNTTGLINYSALLMNLGKNIDAKKLAVRALEIEPNNVQARLLLLEINKGKGG